MYNTHDDSISTSQTFRLWVVIFNLRWPMTFVSLMYDTPGLAPHINVLFWGQGNRQVSHLNMNTSWIAWNRLSWSLRVDTGILFSNMKSPSHECLMTFWPMTCYSDFISDQTSHQFHDLDTELDLHRITRSFHGAIAMGLTYQQGTFTLPGTWFRPLLRNCLCFKCFIAVFLTLPCLLSTFNIEYPSLLSRFSFFAV